MEQTNTVLLSYLMNIEHGDGLVCVDPEEEQTAASVLVLSAVRDPQPSAIGIVGTTGPSFSGTPFIGGLVEKY